MQLIVQFHAVYLSYEWQSPVFKQVAAVF